MSYRTFFALLAVGSLWISGFLAATGQLMLAIAMFILFILAVICCTDANEED